MDCMRRSLSRAWFPILVALALLLVACEEQDGDERRASRPASPSPAETTAGPRLISSYPKRCLKRVRPPKDQGLLAAYRRGQVTIGTPGGDLVASFEARVKAPKAFPSVQWSPDGRYLGTGDGGLWSARGRSLGVMLGELRGPWTWSPTSDCAVGFTGRSLIGFGDKTVSVGGPKVSSRPLIEGPVRYFAFTPGGRALILNVSREKEPPVGTSFWRLDLVTGRLEELVRYPRGACCVELGGWDPTGRSLLFWIGPGTSVMQDGWALSGLDVHRGNRLRFGTKKEPALTLPFPDYVEACGDRLLAVVGGPRAHPTIENKRLALVRRDRVSRILTSNDLVYLSPTCSPDGSQIAAVQMPSGSMEQRGRLVLLDAEGNFVRSASPGGSDGDPQWGRPGIMFLHGSASGTEIWFAPDGSSARTTGLKVGVPWDWSAIPPTGLPYDL